MSHIKVNSVAKTVNLSEEQPREVITLRGPIRDADARLQCAYNIGSGIYDKARLGRIWWRMTIIGLLILLCFKIRVSIMAFSVADGCMLTVTVLIWAAGEMVLARSYKKRIRKEEGEEFSISVRSLEKQAYALSKIIGCPWNRGLNFSSLQAQGEVWMNEQLSSLQNLFEVSGNTGYEEADRIDAFQCVHKQMKRAAMEAPAFFKAPNVPKEWIEWGYADSE